MNLRKAGKKPKISQEEVRSSQHDNRGEQKKLVKKQPRNPEFERKRQESVEIVARIRKNGPERQI